MLTAELQSGPGSLLAGTGTGVVSDSAQYFSRSRAVSAREGQQSLSPLFSPLTLPRAICKPLHNHPLWVRLCPPALRPAKSWEMQEGWQPHGTSQKREGNSSDRDDRCYNSIAEPYANTLSWPLPAAGKMMTNIQLISNWKFKILA